MIKITDYMSRPVITVKRTDTIRFAVKKMDQYNIGSLVVTDGKKPVGIVTERDIVRKALAKGLDVDAARVSKIMTVKLHTIGLNGTLIEVASIMKSHAMRRIIVLNKKGEAVGIVTSKDLVDILCT
jgi:CBS domain-containing protein